MEPSGFRIIDLTDSIFGRAEATKGRARLAAAMDFWRKERREFFIFEKVVKYRGTEFVSKLKCGATDYTDVFCLG